MAFISNTHIFPIQKDVCELKKQIQVQKQFIADQQCTIQDLDEKLQVKTRAHDKGCNTIRLLLIKTRELDAEIEALKSKDVSIFIYLFIFPVSLIFIFFFV